MRNRTIGAALVALAASGSFPALPLASAQPVPVVAQQDRRVDDIRDALLRLPYYGVFDFLTFSYDKGTVTLGGYAYQGSLTQDAERAVRRVRGVDEVVNKIVQLPPSMNDDDIRWRAFYAIYTNDFLSKYAPGGGMLWGRRHPFGGGWSRRFGAFPGEQPVGSYPIHLVVQGGRLRLLGMVDNETDKNVAGIEARGVIGTFGIVNELIVDTDRDRQ